LTAWELAAIASADKLSEFDAVETSRPAPDLSISAPSTIAEAPFWRD